MLLCVGERVCVWKGWLAARCMGIFAFRRTHTHSRAEMHLWRSRITHGRKWENYFRPTHAAQIVVDVFLFEAISPRPVNHVEAQNISRVTLYMAQIFGQEVSTAFSANWETNIWLVYCMLVCSLGLLIAKENEKWVCAPCRKGVQKVVEKVILIYMFLYFRRVLMQIFLQFFLTKVSLSFNLIG